MVRISMVAVCLLTFAAPIRADDFQVLAGADGPAPREMMHRYLMAKVGVASKRNVVRWSAAFSGAIWRRAASAKSERGKVFEVDMFVLPFSGITAPQKLTITAAVEGTRYRNDYEIWVYPPKVDTAVPSGVMLTDSFAAAATQKHLGAGGKVLLLPKLDQLPHSIKGSFQTDFWCFPMFRRGAESRGIEVAPGTLGFLCDPKTPALAEFPTEFHSNWQWWHLVKNSRPIILDDTPAGYRPIVQAIDNFERNHKLGLIFETRVGRGRLLVCAIDLLGHEDKPEARQLLHSLLRYLDSAAFAPKAEVDVELLKRLLNG